jgi:hypothetical protein
MKKPYLSRIALQKNSRGVWCLDTSMGCATGMASEQGGCYGDCYAAKAAKLYGHDFTKTVLRHFDNHSHAAETVRRINGIDAPFVRIGCSGDPSENWQHCLEILKQIRHCNREIIIITRHWTLLTDEQLGFLSGLNLCINTSVSAMDRPEILERSVSQYQRIKPHLKSVLRIVSCDFNLENERGHKLAKIQADLFAHTATLDTVFRPSKANPLVRDGVINVAKHFFNGKRTLASKLNKKTFTGKCSSCTELCGVGIAAGVTYASRPGIEAQMEFLNRRTNFATVLPLSPP